MTLEKYKKLSQQYVAFIQVGGAYAKNYERLIRLLGIKSLIITDIDYDGESGNGRGDGQAFHEICHR